MVSEGRNKGTDGPTHNLSSDPRASTYLPKVAVSLHDGPLGQYGIDEIERAMHAMLKSGQLGHEEYGRARSRKRGEPGKRPQRLYLDPDFGFVLPTAEAEQHVSASDKAGANCDAKQECDK